MAGCEVRKIQGTEQRDERLSRNPRLPGTAARLASANAENNATTGRTIRFDTLDRMGKTVAVVLIPSRNAISKRFPPEFLKEYFTEGPFPHLHPRFSPGFLLPICPEQVNNQVSAHNMGIDMKTTTTRFRARLSLRPVHIIRITDVSHRSAR